MYMDSLDYLLDRGKILDALYLLFLETDNKNWREVKSCFVPKVVFDMTSMTGGEPEELSPDEIVSRWDQGLKNIRHVHHQIGNFRVKTDNDHAQVMCNGIAMHEAEDPAGNNTRTFVGTYDIGMIRVFDSWKVEKLKFNLKFIDGNVNLGQQLVE
jgi:hypothetical protein